MVRFGEDIGIDLGTASVLVYVKGKGIVLQEPSVVAIDKNTDKVIAVGEEARRMLGKTPGNIVAIRPLRNGVIADYSLTERMLRYFIQKVCGKTMFFKPRVVVAIPTGVTGVEQRAVLQATLHAGARKAWLVEEPMAAALGAGINISEAMGHMMVDIGGGTTDIAVISLGGTVCSKSLRLGGDHFDEAINRYVRREYNLLIGDRTAEELKIKIGSVCPNINKSLEIRGVDLVRGLPRQITITSQDTYIALQEVVESVVMAVKEVLEQTPPELASDIINQGIVMTGGGSLLNSLDALISKETKLPVHIFDDAISCVARGTGIILDSINLLNSINSMSRMPRRKGA